jgi:hypothetical protein
MYRYILIFLFPILILSACQIETSNTLSDSSQTIALRESLSGAITEHNQIFREYPMILNDMSPQNRAETEMSYRESLGRLNEQYSAYRETLS